MIKILRPYIKPSSIVKLTFSPCTSHNNFGTTIHPSSSPHFKVPNPNYISRVHDSFNRQGFMGLIGAKLVKVEPGFVEIHLPYRKDLSQQHGFFHAGVIGTLADNCGGYSSFTLFPEDDTVLTVEYKINLLSPADGDMLISKGQVIRVGQSLYVTRSDVFVVKDGQEKLCATSQQTVMGIKGKKDEPGMTTQKSKL